MSAFLFVVKGPTELLERRIQLSKPETVVGSGVGCDVVIAGAGARHAMVRILDNNQIEVQALTDEPIIVGGKSTTKQVLGVGHKFSLGLGVELRFDMPSVDPAPSLEELAAKAAAEAKAKAAAEAEAAKADSTAEATKMEPVGGDAEEEKKKKAEEAKKKAEAAKKAAEAKKAAAKKDEKKEEKKAEPAVRVLAEISLEQGEALSVEDMQNIPIFEGIQMNQLARLPGSVVRRRYKKGEIICREGEYGSTAFYILSGTCDVYIDTPIAHVQSDKKDGNVGGFFGLLRKFKHKLAGRVEDPRKDADNKRAYIPIDGTVDLPMDDPVAKMGPTDLFGEMTCLSFYPRSATVRAAEDCEMLEMLRNVLQVLQKNKTFKEQLDKAYRERALAQHLRSVPMLESIDDKFIDQLRERVELITVDAGKPIVKQGEKADAFYLIRIGTVKVTQAHPGGELVLAYLGRGEFFGEMGIMQGGNRTASCTALDHVELVKISKEDFEFMLGWYDGIREQFEKIFEQRMKASRVVAERAPEVPLDDFLGQGLMLAQSLLLLDLEKCTRCDECVRACADSHDGVTRLVREGLRFDKYLVATSCRSCMDPVCMIGCPVGSIRRKESLEIIIEDWCIGCGICAKQCPYGNITMHSFDAKEAGNETGAAKAEPKKEDKAVTCDLCTELKEPSCVYACPHDAAHRVQAREFFMGARTAPIDQQ